MEDKLQGALEKVLCKPKEVVEVDMAGTMSALKLDVFLPSEIWPPMAAVLSLIFLHC